MPDEQYVDFLLADPYVDPTDGGCWYCYSDDHSDLAFSVEFDTYVHRGCIRERLNAGSYANDGELRIIANELLSPAEIRELTAGK